MNISIVKNRDIGITKFIFYLMKDCLAIYRVCGKRVKERRLQPNSSEWFSKYLNVGKNFMIF